MYSLQNLYYKLNCSFNISWLIILESEESANSVQSVIHGSWLHILHYFIFTTFKISSWFRKTIILLVKNIPKYSFCFTFSKTQQMYVYNKKDKQEGFLWCQTLTSTVRLKAEGCRVKNGGWRIMSEEWRT